MNVTEEKPILTEEEAYRESPARCEVCQAPLPYSAWKNNNAKTCSHQCASQYGHAMSLASRLKRAYAVV